VQPKQALHMAQALARGEPNRERIGLTLFRNVVDEAAFSGSPSGVVARLTDKVGDILDAGDGGDGDGDGDGGDEDTRR
jgi:hypothetical protein